MNSNIRLIIIGGFLGAGKTTTILSIAKKLIDDGKKVGIVTNDQGSELVDTKFLTSEGLHVLEVTEGCFCCNFDSFIDRINNLAENKMPDIILAEPVGSCTDLIATIFKPINLKYTGKFNLSPLSVVVDPKRATKFMIANKSNFPDEINYLFKKQLEEADIILLNKIDTLSQSDIMTISEYLRNTFKGTEVIPISAKNNIGIDQIIFTLVGEKMHNMKTLEIDYNVYGMAEEYLGWLNSNISLHSNKLIDFNQFIVDFMKTAKEEISRNKKEIAHLKVYAVSENDFAKASITALDEDIDFARKMKNNSHSVNLIINARVNAEPTELTSYIEKALKRTCEKYGLSIEDIKTKCFKPKKPNPTYRVTDDNLFGNFSLKRNNQTQ